MRKVEWLSKASQAGYLTIASLSLVLGLIGIVTPLLPTTPFLLIAAWATSKSSPQLLDWLVNQPLIGRSIVAWEQEGAIPTTAKKLAVSLLLTSWLTMLLMGLHWLILSASICGFACIVGFIISRPIPSYEEPGLRATVSIYDNDGHHIDIRANYDREFYLV